MIIHCAMWRTETAAKATRRRRSRSWSRRRRRRRRTSELTLLLLLLLQSSSLCKVSASSTSTRPFIIPGIKASRSRRTSITAVTSCFSNQLLSKSQRRRRSCDSLHSCPQPLFKMGLRGWGYCKKQPYSKEAEMLDSKMKFNPGGRLTSLGVCCCFLMKKMTRTKINYGFKSA